MVFGVTSYYTQQEALRISDRTKAGLEQARRNRRKVLGKPEGFEKRAPTLAQMKEEHWSQERMRRGTGLSYSTVMRYLKRLEA